MEYDVAPDGVVMLIGIGSGVAKELESGTRCLRFVVLREGREPVELACPEHDFGQQYNQVSE